MSDAGNTTRGNKRQRCHDSQQQHQQQLLTPSDSGQQLNMNVSAADAGGSRGSDDAATVDSGLGWHLHSSLGGVPNAAEQDLLYGTMPREPVGGAFETIAMNLSDSFFGTASPSEPYANLTGSLTSPYTASNDLRHLAGDFSPEQPENQPPQRNTHDDAGGGKDDQSIDREQTPMQRLSKLNYELITMLSRIDQGSPKITMKTLLRPSENSSTPSVVDDILHRTRDFIELLKLLAESCLPLSSPSPASASQSSTPTPPNRRRRNSLSSNLSDCDSITGSLTSSTGSPNPSPSAVTTPSPSLELDTPSLLAILTAHIHLLRLYILTYAIESGNLQALILIQIVTSLFERMDALLGLPREYRISTRRGNPVGLLSAPEFLELARAIIKKEDTGRPENGKGGIKALRKHITKAKQMLRESIAP
ncbi:hypothetical protein M406DRAFT_331606 [Cryphonectria parasitica EP155]|uniref:Uncharacterized protein n=1 Tax=Cryphonectria parasitica (strain ATCC 38755 / EP155) TaxID=660469 RepID=A0A9P4XY26_CRYP1|nr:uncharacterized protein M406DRAFT_331606 [Cryphonectria parasitica EP155]KAF3763036.1 hypothetical protein M406DRAFT_331606 [Cryphonectria parasitica EP155]